jgi:hypothetical protein
VFIVAFWLSFLVQGGGGALFLTNHSSHGIVTVTIIAANLLPQYYAAAKSVVSAGVKIDLASPRHSSSPFLNLSLFNQLACMIKEWIKIHCGASLCQMRIASEFFLMRRNLGS